jgi:hypothetical protein
MKLTRLESDIATDAGGALAAKSFAPNTPQAGIAAAATAVSASAGRGGHRRIGTQAAEALAPATTRNRCLAGFGKGAEAGISERHFPLVFACYREEIV